MPISKNVLYIASRMYTFPWVCFVGSVGLMVSALISESNCLGLSSGQGHCVVFLGKILYSHSGSLHQHV